MKDKINPGVGLNLRPGHIDDFLREKPDIPHLEIIAENLFDAPELLEKVSELSRSYPISLHCVGMNIGGIDEVDLKYLDEISKISNAIDAFLISDHLCFQKKGNFYHHDLLPIPLNQETLNHCGPRIKKIQDILGRKIAVENLSYYIEFSSSNIEESEILNQLCLDTGCSLILDLNNYEVNEKNFEISFLSQMKNIDISKVAEIHIAGGEEVEGMVIDTHGTLPSDYSLQYLKENIEQIKGIPICFERDNNVPEFSELVSIQRKLQRRIFN